MIFGDGAFAEGEFHESANLAALWHLPVLFCCENNRYAMGTALPREHANTDLAARAAAYGMTARAVDGMDVEAVRGGDRRRPSSAIRRGGGPVFLELQTYRFRAHSMYDPDRYRDKAEIEHFKALRPDRHPDDPPRRRGAARRRPTSTGSRPRSPPRSRPRWPRPRPAPWEPVADLTRFVMTLPEDAGEGGPVRVPAGTPEGGAP